MQSQSNGAAGNYTTYNKNEGLNTHVNPYNMAESITQQTKTLHATRNYMGIILRLDKKCMHYVLRHGNYTKDKQD
jgi:hypothetical protein